jgi:hypothetical protein
MRVKLLAAACLSILGIILTLGLWPFCAPRNRVAWISNANGLSFSRYGTAFSLAPFSPLAPDEEARHSVEIWIQPDPPRSCSFLSFFDSQQSLFLSMRQSVTDFELQADVVDPKHRLKRAGLYVDEVLSQSKPVFIAITSGSRGTGIYVNGVLVRQAPQFRIAPLAFKGQLILGDAPIHPDGWRGDIRGVAIYDSELMGPQILAHYDAWKSSGQPKVTSDERVAAVYLLNERRGNVIHNQIKPGMDLVIPEDYKVLGKLALEPVWKEFEVSRGYASSLVKNIVGFVPLGFSFYLYLVACRRTRPALTTIISGFLVSFTIEVLQIFLPTRDSGTTDLLTNTLGTWMGVLACRLVGPAWLLQYLPQ